MKMKTRISKVYEAYTALSDNRVEKINDSLYLVASSDRTKKYTVKREEDLFSSNDNATRWQHYAGYPILAVRMYENRISYSNDILPLRKNICWKKENTKFKNDYDKAIGDVLASYSEEDKEKIQKAIEETLEDIESKEYLVRGNRAKLIIRK